MGLLEFKHTSPPSLRIRLLDILRDFERLLECAANGGALASDESISAGNQ